VLRIHANTLRIIFIMRRRIEIRNDLNLRNLTALLRAVHQIFRILGPPAASRASPTAAQPSCGTFRARWAHARLHLLARADGWRYGLIVGRHLGHLVGDVAGRMASRWVCCGRQERGGALRFGLPVCHVERAHGRLGSIWCCVVDAYLIRYVSCWLCTIGSLCKKTMA